MRGYSQQYAHNISRYQPEKRTAWTFSGTENKKEARINNENNKQRRKKPVSYPRTKLGIFTMINFELLDDGKIAIEMIEYIKKCLKIYGTGLIKSQLTPRVHDLFDVDKTSKSLDKRKPEMFKIVTCVKEGSFKY